MVELAQKLEELGRVGQVAGASALFKELEDSFVHTRARLLSLRDSFSP
jgi:hypothetical protein